MWVSILNYLAQLSEAEKTLWIFTLGLSLILFLIGLFACIPTS